MDMQVSLFSFFILKNIFNLANQLDCPYPLSLSTPPRSTWSNCKRFHCSFRIRIWSPSTIFPHLHRLHSPSLLPQGPPHYTSFTILSLLLIPKSMVKGVSQCIPAMSILYFGQFNPFLCSPLPLPSHPTIFSTAFNTYCYILLGLSLIYGFALLQTYAQVVWQDRKVSLLVWGELSYWFP
jgi:hypothetical protein